MRFSGTIDCMPIVLLCRECFRILASDGGRSKPFGSMASTGIYEPTNSVQVGAVWPLGSPPLAQPKLGLMVSLIQSQGRSGTQGTAAPMHTVRSLVTCVPQNRPVSSLQARLGCAWPPILALLSSPLGKTWQSSEDRIFHHSTVIFR